MKKNLFGVMAVIVAVSAAAFTTPKVMDSYAYFEFGGGSFTELEVENPANYFEVSDMTSGCQGPNVKACRIKVSIDQVEGTSPNKTLKSGTIIIAAQATGQSYFYVTIAGDVIDRRNKL